MSCLLFTFVFVLDCWYSKYYHCVVEKLHTTRMARSPEPSFPRLNLNAQQLSNRQATNSPSSSDCPCSHVIHGCTLSLAPLRLQQYIASRSLFWNKRCPLSQTCLRDALSIRLSNGSDQTSWNLLSSKMTLRSCCFWVPPASAIALSTKMASPSLP